LGTNPTSRKNAALNGDGDGDGDKDQSPSGDEDKDGEEDGGQFALCPILVSLFEEIFPFLSPLSRLGVSYGEKIVIPFPAYSFKYAQAFYL